MPHIDNCIGDGLSIHIADLAVHDQHLAVIAAVVQPRLGLEERRAGHVKRTFDRTRGALGDALGLVLEIGADIEEMLEAQARRPQAELRRATGNEVERMPEFVVGHVELVDRLEQVGHDLADDRLEPLVAGACMVGARDLVEEALNIGRLRQLGHFKYPLDLEEFLGSACRDQMVSDHPPGWRRGADTAATPGSP